MVVALQVTGRPSPLLVVVVVLLVQVVLGSAGTRP